jgi:hypothetical protein
MGPEVRMARQSTEVANGRDLKDADRTIWLLPLHPFLLAVLPVLSILAQNDLEVDPSDAVRPILLSLAAVTVLFGLLWSVLRRRRLAALLASAYTLLFHAYGHLYSGHVQGALAPMIARLNLVGDHSHVAIAILVLSAFVTVAIVGLVEYAKAMTVATNAAAVGLVAVALGTTLQSEWQVRQDPPALESAGALLTAAQHASEPADHPDVYYIILDGYGRGDVLADLYNFDNGPFLQALRSMGFYVVERARANYMQTGLSLSSSMNADYLDKLLTGAERTGSNRLPLSRLLMHNQVQQSFRALGYTTVALSSGYRPTELTASEHYLSPPVSGTSLLERLLIENSGLALAQSSSLAPASLRFPGYGRHRRTVQFAAKTLGEQAMTLGSPKFVFVHFLVPHPPFVFDHAGQPRQPGYPYVLLDGSAYPGDPQSYRDSYRDQLIYTNELILNNLEALLEGPAKDALIVLQSDHGPGSGLDWESMANTDLHERLSILLAYRLPAEPGGPIQNFETPINLFRAVFNYTFGTTLPLLEEVSYFSTWSSSYEFMPVPPGQLGVDDHGD